MPTTSNFGWTTPADTDLVKDGAAAIRTLGNGIDTSLVDLKGGTTGQVLSKASNTDLDFSWVAQDDSNAIQNALLTTTGDTIYASAASTPARLGLGTAGQVLTVNSGATAPEWATPSSGGMTLLTSGTISAGTTTLSLTSISQSYEDLRFIIKNAYPNVTSDTGFRLNGDSGSNYFFTRGGSGTASLVSSRSQTRFPMISNGLNLKNVDAGNIFIMDVLDYTTTTRKLVNIQAWADWDGNVNTYFLNGAYDSGTAISAVSFVVITNNLSGGTYELWGIK